MSTPDPKDDGMRGPLFAGIIEGMLSRYRQNIRTSPSASHPHPPLSVAYFACLRELQEEAEVGWAALSAEARRALFDLVLNRFVLLSRMSAPSILPCEYCGKKRLMAVADCTCRARADCVLGGHVDGHWLCGFCFECEKPKFVCGHTSPFHPYPYGHDQPAAE